MVLPLSTFTSEAGIKDEPFRLSAVISQKPMVLVVLLILTPYIPSIFHSERMYRMTSNGVATPFEVVWTHHT